MANPRIFISSTCYDLSIARDQLRSFIKNLGYEPVMSEYSDVLFDPRTHTHTSCLNEIPNVDMVILLVGSRFGGQAIPEALSIVDIENLEKASFDTTILDNPEKLSVTQLEVLKAIEYSIPVFAFVDEKVLHDHFVYIKNKDLSDKIFYPSIEKQETAKYIFEFIDFLKHRIKGNSLIKFSNIEDIENHLRKQWASLFQRLLKEQRSVTSEHNKMVDISEQIEDIKTAILSTIDNSQNREVARGTIKYRRLIDLIINLHISDESLIFSSATTFEQFLNNVGIEHIEDMRLSRGVYGRTALVKQDGTFFELRYPLNRFSIEWQSYIKLSKEIRKVIYEAIEDLDHPNIMMIRYRNEQYSEYIQRFKKLEDGDEEEEFTISDLEDKTKIPSENE